MKESKSNRGGPLQAPAQDARHRIRTPIIHFGSMSDQIYPRDLR